MKRTMLILLAICFLFALFSGACTNKTATEGDSTGAPTQSTTRAPETQPPEEPGGVFYNLPAGKYEVDEKGVPTTPYVYPLPMTNSDEVYTYLYTSFLPDYIPEEGYSTLPYPAELRNRTGVTIEYVVVAMQSLPEQFPILLAADDLPNVIINADWYYQGSLTSGVDDGYFANLYEYREYMPNYWYIAHSHPEDPSFLAHLLPEDDMIVSMWCYEQERAFLYGTVTRGDWLEKLGMVNDDLVTFDDIHILLKTFKTEFDCDWPFMLTKTLDNYGFFNAMDTIPVITNTLGALVDNGQVAFTHTRAQDFNFMTLINQWYSEGLIEPDWMSIAASVDAKDLITAGKMAVVGLVPTEVPGYEPPNAVVADRTCILSRFICPWFTRDKPYIAAMQESGYLTVPGQ